MRRILLLLSVALVMAAMVVATAAPAFAKDNCDKFSEPGLLDCRGGEGSGGGGGGGGFGGKNITDRATFQSFSGGAGSGGGGSGGGGGSSCDLSVQESVCHGKGFSTQP